MTSDITRVVSQAKSLYRQERREAKVAAKSSADPMVDPHGPGTVTRVISNMNENRTPRQIVREDASQAREDRKRQKALSSIPGMKWPMVA